MNESIQQEQTAGSEPSPEEIELVEWARAAVAKSVPLLQESLRQMVTLTTALLAGSAALPSSLPLPTWCKVMASFLLLIALGLALFGSFPREANLDVQCPEDIKAERLRGMSIRTRCLAGSAASLLIAFAVVVLGLAVKLFSSPASSCT